jgi:hypothetical protein
MRSLAIRRQGKTGLREKAKWALHGARQFSRLIGDIRDLVDDLEGFLPAAEVERLCETEISELDQAELPLLQEVAATEDTILNQMIKKAIEPAQNSYNVTFSGSNTSGLQLGINTGTIGNLSFGTAKST